MAIEYGVFVITPPPSETFLVARGKTLEEARKRAIEWGGDMEWASMTQAISHYGERVAIEEITTPLRKGATLGHVTWDVIFETTVFEKYLAPELGFHVDRFGEVVREERKAFHKIWEKQEQWLMSALRARGVEAYSIQGSEIYIADVKDIIKEFRVAHRDPKDWAPSDQWKVALARALKKLLGDR